MNDFSRQILADLGCTIDERGTLSVGNARGDALTAGVDYCVPLIHLTSIRASGADAATFLQNLLTNDALKLAADRAELNGVCTPKGRLLASFLMWREGEDFCLSLAADVAAGILKKLRMYVLRSKVTLTDETDTRVSLGLTGEAATRYLSEHGVLPEAGDYSVTTQAGLTVIRLAGARYQLVAPASDAPALIDALVAQGLTLGATNVWNAFDIAAGVPLITARTQEAFVPQMVNFELLGGVSFKKGCYPGQEIVARTQYLGKLKKRMYRIGLAAGNPQPGDHVFGVDLADQSCGEIVNVAAMNDGHFEALAVLQMSSVQAGPLHLGAPDGPILTVLPLPYEIA